MSIGAIDGWEQRRAGDGGDAVRRIVAGDLTGAVVADLLSPAERGDLLALCEALPRHRLSPDHPEPSLAGRPLSPTWLLPSGPDLGEYFDEAESVAPTMHAAWPLVARLFEACCDLPVGLLQRPRPHAVGTLRTYSDGHGLQLNCDTFLPSPAFTHLHKRTDRSVQLNWFVVLGMPASGGLLRVDPHLRTMDHEPSAEVPIPLNVGDAVVFDGANHFHEITPVVGPTPRLTFGGFAGLSPEHDRLLFWG